MNIYFKNTIKFVFLILFLIPTCLNSVARATDTHIINFKDVDPGRFFPNTINVGNVVY